jgi:hypothetical protein
MHDLLLLFALLGLFLATVALVAACGRSMPRAEATKDHTP